MDAYTILGVSRKASKAEIDAAYKAMLDKYSEEKYQNGPLTELAAKKREELYRAYEEVIKDRMQKSQEEKTDTNSFSGGAASTPEYAQIRQFINIGNLAEAQRLLS